MFKSVLKPRFPSSQIRFYSGLSSEVITNMTFVLEEKLRGGGEKNYLLISLPDLNNIPDKHLGFRSGYTSVLHPINQLVQQF